MKLAFLSSFAHLVLDENETRTSGGAELQVALLARTLASQKRDVVILSGDTGQPDAQNRQGVRIRNAGNFHTGNNLEMLRSIPRVLHLLKEEKPDWVFVLGWTAWLFVLWAMRPLCGYRLGFICGLDTEVNGRFAQENPLRGGLFDFAMRRCDVRYAMTELQQNLYRERGLDSTLYRNLILPRKSPAPNPRDKSIDFLWVSRCRSIKRPLLFLDLARSLPDSSFEMICPPEDPVLFSQVRDGAKSLPNLRLLDGVPYHKIQDHYDAARIFVNTSDWEGWANSFIQSGQARTALLSLSVKPDTLFEDFALGFCAAGNWDAFVREAQKMAANPESTASMGMEAERFVRTLHDNDRETAAFLSGLKRPQK